MILNKTKIIVLKNYHVRSLNRDRVGGGGSSPPAPSLFWKKTMINLVKHISKNNYFHGIVVVG